MKFKVNAQSNELLIYGPIGDDFWSEQSVLARDVVDALKDMSGELTVRINSQGGSMEDAIAIATAIQRYPGSTFTEIDGVAHSAASFIAMAADTIRMAATGVMMIHGPSMIAAGNRRDLADADAALAIYTEAMRPAYERAGAVPAAKVDEWLTDGNNHYFTASEALEFGLIDEIFSELSVAAISLNGRQDMSEEHKAAVLAAKKAEKLRIAELEDVTSLEIVQRSLEPKAIRTMLKKAIDEDTTPDELRLQVLKLVSAVADEPITARSPHDGGRDGSGRVSGGVDEHDQIAAGITDALLVRMNMDKDGEIQKRVRQSEYMGMSCVEMARRTLEANGTRVRGMNRNDIIGAAITASGRRGGYRVTADRGITHTPSDFPALMENALNKTVLRGWAEAEETWRKIARPGNIFDFRPAPRAALGEMPSLPIIDPNTGEFKYVTVSDRKEELILGTYGDIIGISRAALVNDDLQQFGRLGEKQGRAASRTVGDLVYFVLTSNPTMQQTGQPLFSVAHNNIAQDAGPPTIARLDEMTVIMGLQSDPDQHAHGLALPLQKVIVPLELRTTTRVLLRSQYDPDNVGNSRADNPFQGEFEVVADPRLSADSSVQWYGSTNPDSFDLIEVGFLEGNQEPYMETKEGWTVDGIEMKVRIDATAGPLDFRTIVRNAGA